MCKSALLNGGTRVRICINCGNEYSFFTLKSKMEGVMYSLMEDSGMFNPNVMEAE